jgi:hypothetical protein
VLGELGAAQWVYAQVDPARVTRWRQDGAVRPFAHWPEQYGDTAPATPRCEIVDLT